MLGHKERYRQFCAAAAPGAWPLHLQPWWLDAVCGGADAWEVALALDGGGRLLGAWPWYRSRRWGLPVALNPPLTAYAGPWLTYPTERTRTPADRNAFEQKVFDALVPQLPRTVFFRQTMRPELLNWLPLYWAGFRQTTRYTYFFEQTTDRAALWAGFKTTLRTDLRKAERWVIVQREDEALALAYALYGQARRFKKARPAFSMDTLTRLHAALRERGQMACFVARGQSDHQPKAALYLAFDARQAAVLFIGRDPAAQGSCAVPALLWEALRFAGERGLSLDFEGSMEQGTERLFRAFGGKRLPYHQVSRWNFKW